MKIFVIAAKADGEGAPWIMNAWDEWTIDSNPSGFDEACTKAEGISGRAQIRIGIVEVPDQFLFDLFKPIVTKGTPVTPKEITADDDKSTGYPQCKDDHGSFSV